MLFRSSISVAVGYYWPKYRLYYQLSFFGAKLTAADLSYPSVKPFFNHGDNMSVWQKMFPSIVRAVTRVSILLVRKCDLTDSPLIWYSIHLEIL